MAESAIGEILGAVLGSSGDAAGGNTAGGLGSLGGVLGGVLGGGSTGSLGGLLGGLAAGLGGGTAANAPTEPGSSPSGGHLAALLLPLALGWVQRSGGVGAVLDRFREQGLGAHADSWVSTQPNAPLAPQDVHQVVGGAELDAMAQRLGVSREQVAHGLGEILPQVVDKLSPGGALPQDADARIDNGLGQLSAALSRFQ